MQSAKIHVGSELLYKGNESVPLAKWRDYTFPIEFGFEVRTGSNQLENWVRSNYFWADPEAEDSITYVICYEDSAVQRNDATKSIAPNLPKNQSNEITSQPYSPFL